MEALRTVEPPRVKQTRDLAPIELATERAASVIASVAASDSELTMVSNPELALACDERAESC